MDNIINKLDAFDINDNPSEIDDIVDDINKLDINKLDINANENDNDANEKK
jgi:hypothetical protein